jgi:predicted alpha/beta-hydrolase family hydrolase
MTGERVSIPLTDGRVVSGVLWVPEVFADVDQIAVILAHGAGNDMDHPLMVTMSEGLGREGYVTLRFNFPYREEGRRAPDPQQTLVMTWESVYRFLKQDTRSGAARVVAIGKSMGGRVASQMVAEGSLPLSCLVFLGYPLHPPGKKDKLRDAHLYDIRIPMLFFAGTRDPLCNMAELEGVLSRLNAPAELEAIEGGDHSFRLRKGAPMPQQDVYNQVLHKTLSWLKKM